MADSVGIDQDAEQCPRTKAQLTERLRSDDKSVRLMTKRFNNILSECQALHMSASSSKLRMGRSGRGNE